jgi:hypothetical protein
MHHTVTCIGIMHTSSFSPGSVEIIMMTCVSLSVTSTFYRMYFSLEMTERRCLASYVATSNLSGELMDHQSSYPVLNWYWQCMHTLVAHSHSTSDLSPLCAVSARKAAEAHMLLSYKRYGICGIIFIRDLSYQRRIIFILGLGDISPV